MSGGAAAGIGAAGGPSAARGICTVFFALPHAVRIAATAGGGKGNALLDGSASTQVTARTARMRPLTHHESVTTMPGGIANNGWLTATVPNAFD